MFPTSPGASLVELWFSLNLTGGLELGMIFPPILCIAMIAVWSESKFMKPYPAGSPVNLLVITLMLTTPVSPIIPTAF